MHKSYRERLESQSGWKVLKCPLQLFYKLPSLSDLVSSSTSTSTGSILSYILLWLSFLLRCSITFARAIEAIKLKNVLD